MKKYEYEVATDPLQDDKSTEIVLQKFGRPHMRAFHASWISLFMALVAWFSIAPILPTIKVQSVNAIPNENAFSFVCFQFVFLLTLILHQFSHS